MERRLVKQGNGALTVTLPAAWLAARDLQAGDAVQVAEGNDSLIISAQRKTAHATITIDGNEAVGTMLHHRVSGAYIAGYDTIIILDAPATAIERLQSYFLGMHVEEHTDHRFVLRSLIQTPDADFRTLLRRAGHLLSQQAGTLVEAAEGNASSEDVKMSEKLLDQTLHLCLRYLVKYETRRPSYRDFLVCATLESAGDEITRLAAVIGTDKKLAHIVHHGVERYITNLFAGDFKKLYTDLRAFRSALPTKSFAHGLAYTLAETLYNYIGYASTVEQ
jgi:phosphate uptake regulator